MSQIVRADGLPWPNGSRWFDTSLPIEVGDVIGYADAAGTTLSCRLTERRDGDVWVATIVRTGGEP